MLKDHIWELFLGQIVLYATIYYFNPYIGFLLCLVMGCISAAILILSFIFEAIEKSKVPRSYFLIVFVSILAPFLVLGVFSTLDSGAFDWLSE